MSLIRTDKGKWVATLSTHYDNKGWYETRLDSDWAAIADTAPEAICLAALKASE